MSRNQDRLGGVQQHDSSPPVQAMNENAGGFSFVIPTEFVELPTGGRYYPPGHPLHGESAIEIKQMTAKEEDMLTSRTLLKKGVALDRVIGSLIVNKAIDPDSLYVGDRNAIIVATRVSGYGNDYTTKVTCPQCAASQTGVNEKQLVTGAEVDKKQRIDRGITRQLAAMIEAVNGDPSIEAIRYLVENIPSSDSRHLRTAYKLTAPNVDMTQQLVWRM